MVDSGAGHAIDRGGQDQLVVVFRRRAKAAFDPGDGKENASFLQVSISKAREAQKFRPSHLEILKVFRVVQIVHRIAFGVADPEGDIARCRRFVGHAPIVVDDRPDASEPSGPRLRSVQSIPHVAAAARQKGLGLGAIQAAPVHDDRAFGAAARIMKQL